MRRVAPRMMLRPLSADASEAEKAGQAWSASTRGAAVLVLKLRTFAGMAKSCALSADCLFCRFLGPLGFVLDAPAATSKHRSARSAATELRIIAMRGPLETRSGRGRAARRQKVTKSACGLHDFKK